MPVVREDEVTVTRGQFKGQEGKVVAVYRKKYCIHVERCTKEKSNGQSVNIGLDASNCVITKLKLDKSRKSILDRKNRAKDSKKTGANLGGVD
jgi:ribosomal protein uL24